VWPLDSARREHLRIGARAVERWVGATSRLECIASHALPATPGHAGTGEHLQAALQALYAGRKSAGAVTLVLESALMPALLVETGAELWTPAQVQQLVRHRLGALYGAPGAAADAWDVRIDYRIGERFALGYGLPVALAGALAGACAAAGLRCRHLLPGLAWGLGLLKPARHWPGHRGWFAWAEQDRTLLARIEDGRAVALNAAAPAGTDPAHLLRQVGIESIRSGTPTDDPILATRWSAEPAARLAQQAGQLPAVSWLDIGGPDGGDAPAARTPSARAATAKP
jgi:hypothetical protein